MIEILKKKLYFSIASYFRFFAEIRLRRWKPRIVVVTGSSGKTTLLHMLEAQIGERAIYSHHANSSFGIPFFVLGLERKSFKMWEWVEFFVLAAVNAYKKSPKSKVFVVEADTDRWGEGKFLAEFLRPEVVAWVSVGKTHGVNFEKFVSRTNIGVSATSGESIRPLPRSPQEAIAYDFGWFVEYCKGMVVINGDLELEERQRERASAKVIEVRKGDCLEGYRLVEDKTVFGIEGEEYSFKAILPEEVFYSVVMCREVCKYLGVEFDRSFKKLKLPPGRSSVFKGIKGTMLMDSSYNANFSSMKAVLKMFEKMPGKKKWVVFGDMLELGEDERGEHERLGELVKKGDFERVLLVGKRMGNFTYPKLISLQVDEGSVEDGSGLLRRSTPRNDKMVVERFMGNKEALEYIKNNLGGGELILFKGSQSLYLEWIIERLLKNEDDAAMLPRRGEFWERKRSVVSGE